MESTLERATVSERPTIWQPQEVTFSLQIIVLRNQNFLTLTEKSYMKNLILLFFVFITLAICNIYCFTQGNYKHKSEAEIASMTPAQKVDEFFKERY